ncbi:formimidoylglutamase [Paracoccus aurantiacus]|uniref:Formimidoylglutamase n=1 Tax=Paracoccus aurantiacus TaxID=2599412 RepID=A0A5C6S5W4_9RHOB|nr:formimidoylglutamase [Paracoccus aurantiacus]TXB69014.1 formimidoylglutamase [Paracoccus aurantiacus]
MPVQTLPPPVWTGRSDPEDGALALRMHHLAGKAGAGAALIGFCCDAGVVRNKGNPGAAEAPGAIRAALAGLAAPAGFDGFRDAGDIAVTGDDPGPGQDVLAAELAALIGDYRRVVVLGGGHETAFGSWQGLRRALPEAKIGIVNIDAHLDIRALGAAGASSGTPFFQIHQDDPHGFDYAVLGLAPEGNTQALTARAQDWGVDMIADRELQVSAEAGFAAIDAIAARNDALYLTVDLDVLPASVAPGVSAPAARGVPLHVVEALIDRALASGKVRLADMVELSPPRDTAGLSARVAALIARRLLI